MSHRILKNEEEVEGPSKVVYWVILQPFMKHHDQYKVNMLSYMLVRGHRILFSYHFLALKFDWGPILIFQSSDVKYV